MFYFRTQNDLKTVICSLAAFWLGFTLSRMNTALIMGKKTFTYKMGTRQKKQILLKDSKSASHIVQGSMYSWWEGKMKKEKKLRLYPVFLADNFLLLHPSLAMSRSQPRKGLLYCYMNLQRKFIVTGT